MRIIDANMISVLYGLGSPSLPANWATKMALMVFTKTVPLVTYMKKYWLSVKKRLSEVLSGERF